jgi:hypothetical protein
MTSEIVNQLRKNSECLAPSIMLKAADTIERLTAERDEARRQYCRGFTDFCPNPAHNELTLEEAAMEVAKSFGWDCFKQGDGK